MMFGQIIRLATVLSSFALSSHGFDGGAWNKQVHLFRYHSPQNTWNRKKLEGNLFSLIIEFLGKIMAW